jgi:hypothetical protein
MLDTTTMVDPVHRRSVAEGMVRTTTTCMMSSVTEMHATGLKTSVEDESA